MIGKCGGRCGKCSPELDGGLQTELAEGKLHHTMTNRVHVFLFIYLFICAGRYLILLQKTFLNLSSKFTLLFLLFTTFLHTNFAYLMNKSKSFARPLGAFFVSVYFFPVLGKSAT